MKKYKLLLIFIILVLISLSGFLYFWFLYKAPDILNSEKSVSNYEKFLTGKIGHSVKIKDFHLATYPNLSFEIDVSKIYVPDRGKDKILEISGVNYDANIFAFKSGNLFIKNIFANIPEIRKKMVLKNKNKKSKILYFPVINICKTNVILSKNLFVNIGYISSKKSFGTIITKMLATLDANDSRYPVVIGNHGRILYDNNKVKFDDFSVGIGKSELLLSGDMKELSAHAKDLSAGDLSSYFLYFYKLRHPDKKNFLENFHKLSGLLDVDLKYSSGKFDGTCTGKNLKAYFFDYMIPIHLPSTVFTFKDKHVSAKTNGTFGGEPVYTDFYLDGIATKDVLTIGTVKSTFTDKITKKYYPDVTIKGKANAQVDYKTRHEIVDIKYSLELHRGNSLAYKGSSINNDNKLRKIYMNTVKKDDNVKIKSYDYSLNENNIWKKLLYGEGEINKYNGKYKLSSITLKSNGNVYIDLMKSLTDSYLTNNTFNADLKYDALNKIIDGELNFSGLSHSDYLYLDSVNINAKNNKLSLNSGGKFYDSPIIFKLEMPNQIKKDIIVNNLSLYLKDFSIYRDKFSNIRSSKSVKKNNSSYKRPNISIDNISVKIDRIYNDKFEVYDILINGNLNKDGLVKFSMPGAKYANGLLKANGNYNVLNHSSDINFSASDIDSNIVVSKMFKLPNHVNGTARANLHLKTKNKLNDIRADANFEIADGHLPKLGTTEFVIHKNKKNNKEKTYKFTLEKITNIDFDAPGRFYSNLYGSFSLINDEIKNVGIFSKSDYVGLYIEGDYNINNQNGELYVWGKNNKTAAKKIRILKIPVNLVYKIVFKTEHTLNQYLDKLNKVPDIKANITDEISVFKIYIKGKFNTKNVKVIMKNLKD